MVRSKQAVQQPSSVPIHLRLTMWIISQKAMPRQIPKGENTPQPCNLRGLLQKRHGAPDFVVTAPETPKIVT
jgi:hypothetical protein